MKLTPAKLNKIYNNNARMIADRHSKFTSCIEEKKYSVLVCHGSGCSSNCSHEIEQEFEKQIKEHKLTNVSVSPVGCFGLCQSGPICVVYPDGALYYRLKKENVKDIVEQHLMKQEIPKNLAVKTMFYDKGFVPISQSGFFRLQKRIVLRNSAISNPEKIDEYIGSKGYIALAKVLKMKPKDVIEEIKKSQLRGRGGAGFPTGLKWETAFKQKSNIKYVICNADEGDPGAFMNRSLVESDPFSILEGLTIAAYAIGASKGYIYIRHDYELAVARIKNAIKQATEYGLLGNNILGSKFSFDVEIKYGTGEFIGGEETALINVIEGKRCEPRITPPYPAQSGLWGKPTVANNVETLANISPIILNGWEWFASIGTEKSKGTKVLSIGGQVKYPGLVEVPFGTSILDILYVMGGGMIDGKQHKSLQTGGPSGGCIPAWKGDVVLDYEEFAKLGTTIGSGTLIPVGENSCIVDNCKFQLDFLVEESCGKCVPCRIGLKRIHEILTKMEEGRSNEQEVKVLEDLCKHMQVSCACALGQSAPTRVLSGLANFRDEFMAHARDKKCPAGVCKALFRYIIQQDKCKKCGLCAMKCPVKAIDGDRNKGFEINQAKCLKCGLCARNCNFKAIKKD